MAQELASTFGGGLLTMNGNGNTEASVSSNSAYCGNSPHSTVSSSSQGDTVKRLYGGTEDSEQNSVQSKQGNRSSIAYHINFGSKFV